MPKSFYIGTSGWSYKHWKGLFYPDNLNPRDYLKFYAQHFDIAEINTSFYHLPKRQTVINWTNAMSPGFKYCPKLSRYITHYQKLNNPEESLQLFMDVFEPMMKKMGPVLVQLPHFVKYVREKTENFYSVLATTYKGYHFAMEVRDESWFTDESLELMKKYKIALVISHSYDKFPYIEAVTAKDIYYRFHGPKELYASNYTTDMLAGYAEKFIGWIQKKHRVWHFLITIFTVMPLQMLEN
jgi:uncharacterized protein YecE (DUF72 family)